MPPEPTPAPRRDRRIAALVLPELSCELIGPEVDTTPLGVVLVKQGDTAPSVEAPHLTPRSPLAAVNEQARRRGVRPGQTIAEATALVARLAVRQLPEKKMSQALASVAELALGFGKPVSWEAPDTVWLDVTGSTRLWGGEQALAETLTGQVRAWGHQVRLAIASGPLLARAFARWGEVSPEGVCFVPPDQTCSQLAHLPLLALPLAAETVEWFARLGVLTVGQLRALPPRSAAPRLGNEARLIRELCEGRDAMPLVPYEPPPVLVEEVHWEEPVSGLTPLLFSLRGLVTRLSARLEGRGEAARALWLDLQYDPALARQRGIRGTADHGPPGRRLQLELASPLWREAELERILRARLERLQLAAPIVALRVTAPALVAAQVRQLQLGRRRFSGDAAAWDACEGAGPEELSVLLAELAADVGSEQVGRLRWIQSHRPESSSALEPLRALDQRALDLWAQGSPRGGAKEAELRGAESICGTGIDVVTRLLPRPIPFPAPLREGEPVGLGRRFYTIERVRFVQRLEAVEWWTPQPVSRDYLRVWLGSPDGGLEALVFVDRDSGQRYLQAVLD